MNEEDDQKPVAEAAIEYLGAIGFGIAGPQQKEQRADHGPVWGATPTAPLAWMLWRPKWKSKQRKGGMSNFR